MQSMVFLIGTNHEIQYIYKDTNQNRRLMLLSEQFAQYLENKTKELKISLIAEELNEKEIHKNNRKPQDSTARTVAKKLKIDHLFCDPTMSERKTLGIPSESEIMNKLNLKYPIREMNDMNKIKTEERKHWGIREQFWYDKIKHRLEENIIFICGHCHVDRFESSLSKKGHKVTIVVKDWCKENEG
jgi:hypothetical protein